MSEAWPEFRLEPERPAILDIAEDDLLMITDHGESTLHRVASVKRDGKISVTLTTEQAGSALPATDPS